MLAIATTLVPLPLLAADRATPLPAQPIKASIAKHAARDMLVTASKSEARSARQAGAQRANPQSSGFLRSPAGIACIAVLAAGTGYALYSASHDRIHSVARESQK